MSMDSSLRRVTKGELDMRTAFFGSDPVQHVNVFLKAVRPHLSSTQPPIQWMFWVAPE